jgi:hypothetical protein
MTMEQLPRFASALEIYPLLPPDAQELVRRFVQHPAAACLWSSRRWCSLWGEANGWYKGWQERRDAVLTRGLPLRIAGAVLDEEFLSIHVDIDEAHLIRSHAARGFQLHITLGYASDWGPGIALEAMERINKRWRGLNVIAKIEWMGSGGAVFFAEDDPLAIDWDIAWLHSRGWYSDRGLHISL